MSTTFKDREARWDEAVALLATASTDADSGQLAIAFAGAKRASRILARVVGITHPDYASACVALGRIEQARGHLHSSVPYFRSAASILVNSRHGGRAVDELTVDALLALALCMQELGRFGEARTHARRALQISRQRLGATAALTASAHNTLGVIGKFAGRFVEAERHYRAALAITRRRFGASSRQVATILHNLGGLEHARGNFGRGEPHARRSVEIARQLMRPSDPERVAHEVAYAALLDGLGHHTKTVPIYRRAVTAFTKRYGREHYEVASTLHNLAAAEYALDRIRAAETHFAEASALLSKLRGKDHPDLALTQYNLALLYRDTGRRARARAMLTRALRTFRRRLPSDHPHVRACKTALASLDGS